MGRIFCKGRTPLARIDEILNKDKYIEILNQNLFPFAEKYHGGTYELIFQEDGCGLYRSKAVRCFLDAKGIELLPCPAKSLDMSTIENAWEILKRSLRQKSTNPTSKYLLLSRLAEVWDSLPSSRYK